MPQLKLDTAKEIIWKKKVFFFHYNPIYTFIYTHSHNYEFQEIALTLVG